MKFVPLRHVYRMFPYEFFKELNEAWDEWIPFQPMFTIPYTDLKDNLNNWTEEQKKENFDEYRLNHKPYDHANIIEIDFTYIMPLMPYIKKDLIDKKTAGSKDPNQLDFLVVQYFDSSQQPIFAPTVTTASVREIPEILYDDPNLLIGVVTTKIDQPESFEIAVLKAPSFIMDKMTEPIERDEPT